MMAIRISNCGFRIADRAAVQKWGAHLVAVGGYILLTILFTWPLALHLRTALPGEGTDSWQYLWNFWWFDQAFFHGRPLYFTTAQYYPLGTSLLFHTLSPLHSLVALPARFLGGYVAAYNWIVLLAGVLSGYGTFLLALEALRPAPVAQASESASGVAFHSPATPGGAPRIPHYLAAFVAGAAFTLAPYRSVHLLGHLSLISTETLPFFALFAWRAVRRPGWRPALGVALSWLAAMLIDWYYPLYMVLLAGFFLAWTLGEALLRRRPWKAWLHGALAVGGGFLAAALALSPLLVPMLRQSRQAAYLEEPLSFSTTMGADLAAFFLPSPLQPLWGKAFSRWTDPLADGNTAEGIVYLGIVVLVLAGIGLWRERRRGALWAALSGTFAFLALGPSLKVFNLRTGVPLPYLSLAYLPIVRFTRVPSRYVVLAHLGLAVLVGLGAAALLGQKGTGQGAARAQRTTALKKKGRPALRHSAPAVLLLALIALDYLPAPYPLTPAVVNPFYRQLAADPRQYALLELPLQRPNSQWYYTHWMLDQTVHGKDSFRGYISRGDPLFNFGGAPFLRQLAGLGERDITYDDWRPLAASVLHHYHVGYIVLERGRLEEQGQWAGTRQLVQEVLAAEQPAYADGELEAYPVPEGSIEPFIALGSGWHEVEEQPWGPFRWMDRDRAVAYLIAPEAQTTTLSFQAVGFLRPRRLEIVRDGQTVSTLEVSTALQPYSLTLALPAGETRLELRADGYDVPREVGAGDDPRAVSVGFSRMGLEGP